MINFKNALDIISIASDINFFISFVNPALKRYEYQTLLTYIDLVNLWRVAHNPLPRSLVLRTPVRLIARSNFLGEVWLCKGDSHDRGACSMAGKVVVNWLIYSVHAGGFFWTKGSLVESWWVQLMHRLFLFVITYVHIHELVPYNKQRNTERAKKIKLKEK